MDVRNQRTRALITALIIDRHKVGTVGQELIPLINAAVADLNGSECLLLMAILSTTTIKALADAPNEVEPLREWFLAMLDETMVI